MDVSSSGRLKNKQSLEKKGAACVLLVLSWRDTRHFSICAVCWWVMCCRTSEEATEQKSDSLWFRLLYALHGLLRCGVKTNLIFHQRLNKWHHQLHHPFSWCPFPLSGMLLAWRKWISCRYITQDQLEFSSARFRERLSWMQWDPIFTAPTRKDLVVYALWMVLLRAI